MTDDYRYIGSVPTDLDGGRPIEPGEFTGAIEITDETPKNQQLLDEGLLIKVPAPATTDTSDSKGKTTTSRPRGQEGESS